MTANISAVLVLIFLGLAPCSAQTTPKEPASISGRITIAGKGVADVTVLATTTNSSPFSTATAARTTTDDDGNYRLIGLAPGRFTIIPIAKAYAISFTDAARGQPGRSINVSAGEEITKIDFTLVRGGVITGRITDADGTPIIGESVTIVPTDTKSTSYVSNAFDGPKNRTDDRGIYRTYGLAPGTYKVSVGQSKPSMGGSAIFQGGSRYVQTFYPGVQDEAKATLVEIKEGSEAKDIDISTTKGAKGFSVSGRVIDSASGQPVANVYVGYASLDNANVGGSMNFASSPTDANGKFTIDGLSPGQYNAYTFGAMPDNSSYSDSAKFEVIDGDVSGIEIKLNKGATISGMAVIENSPDPSATALLPTVNLYAYTERTPGTAPSFARGKINADGTFRFKGLAPGKVRVQVQDFPSSPKGLTLLRLELNGVDQRDGIEVTAGAEINDVRMIFAYGGGSLKGSVKFLNGPPPDGTVMWALLTVGPENSRGFRRFIEIDSRFKFSSENIPPGTYDLTVRGAVGGKELSGFTPVKQTVVITHGVETQVTVEVNYTPGKEGAN
ncbi:MAG TPA: carboxypeptidase-like regulatory domain-containing protein [Pyrinomonadaceae bacterium]|nr:carboxypeptidase-like regulatory domain-containing protein [Pyrinomonadaceae bacterium]